MVMADWTYAQTDPAEQLAQIHYYSYLKQQSNGPVEFVIAVKEYATPASGDMQFFAQTDKETNQKATPFRPFGWHRTMLGALAACIDNIKRFDYEGD
jgi:hypothetical protein